MGCGRSEAEIVFVLPRRLQTSANPSKSPSALLFPRNTRIVIGIPIFSKRMSADCRDAGAVAATAPASAPGRAILISAPTASRRAHVRPAACKMRSVISCGCEMSDKWLDFTSIVVAPMRLAMNRSRSGLIVRSSVETA
jgi:hypothetical protein